MTAMTTPARTRVPATLNVQPQRGVPERDVRARDAMQGTILIPDRPQSKRETEVGRLYMYGVENAVRAALPTPARPLIAEGFVRIQLDLYYSLPTDAPGELATMPHRWSDFNIPRGDLGGNLILAGLKQGGLIASLGQVQPLVIMRYVFPAERLVQEFGVLCRRGCAVVKYEAIHE